MLRPFLLVGVGGSGGKTLRAIRQGLKAKLQQEGWDEGIPEAWQFLHVDSPQSQDGLEFPAPLLPREDYLSLVPQGVNYATVYQSIKGKADGKFVTDIEKPLPSDREVAVPIALGAGAYRAIGRTIAVAALDQVHSRAATALTRMQTNNATSQLTALTRHLGVQVSGKQDPTVIIVSSIAGGSGAGMFIDVTEAVKSAAQGQPWAERTFAVLYAPDVFEQVGNMDSIAPNALGAIAETMSGYWNTSPSESTQSLYRSAGLLPMQTAASKIGPAFTYVVGRKNGSVDFGSQSGVYKAIATSICTWMTDDKVQDSMSAYAVANFSAKALPLPDNTMLKRAAMDAPPFSSLGFARVSLGMERFVDYASERLAKQTLNTILYRHLEQDPGLKEKTEEQWKAFYADSSEGRFLTDSLLNELTEANNQVLDALAPESDMVEPQISFKNAIQSQVEGAVKPAGVDLSTWVQWITNAYEVQLPSSLENLRALRNARIRTWVETMPKHISALVTRYVSEQGMPVTVELVKRLIDQCKRAAAELLEEKNRHLADSSQIQNLVSGALAPVSASSAIPKTHPAIEQAYYQTQVCFHYRGQADLKQSASELLSDFVENFLQPLFKEMASGVATLISRVNDPKLLDQRENPFPEWPDFSSTSVPLRFKPAPNERLLIDYASYPKEFDTLVKQTVSDTKVDAKRVVVDEVVMGTYGVEALKSLKAEHTWKLLSSTQPWIPQERSFQVRESAPSPARFTFATDHMEYLEFASKWLNIPGRAFNAYLEQRIATYLNDDSDKEEQAKRQSRFVKEFQAAVSSADPLVQLDGALVTEVHTPAANEKSVVFSAIPVDIGDALFEPLKDILVTYKYWVEGSSDKWFQGAGAAGNVRYIDIFTQTAFPLQPIVMSSVMGPISQTWGAAASKRISRTNFMKWRRGRTLSESMPASPEVWRQMLRGWYVARLLNQVSQEKDEISYDEMGPKVSVWVDPGNTNVNFPYPLMYPDIAQVSDMPGIVMESLIVAMSNCYTEHSLRPLMPYHRLLKLGGASNQLDRELAEWIANGKLLLAGTPAVDEKKCGSATMSMEDRQAKCVAFLEEELAKFNKQMDGLSKFEDPRTYPVSWEIRADIVKAMHDLISGIKAVAKEDEL
ncbi:MAG: hypothetical protein RLZZ258_1230 [Actinomycetota bacterium]|jgi:hypothetical protein